ncbi:MAG: lysophospholipid acyltransferase family protein [Synergistaceae bacterium]|nr:lysophospholipid acyltransferase family protein [Synergistaceae bacterium]
MKAAVAAIRFFEHFSRKGLRADLTKRFFSGLLKLIKPRGDLILENLARVYPESSERWRRDLRSKVYENIAWTLAETLALQHDHSQAFQWVRSFNTEILDNLMEENRGVLLLSAHFGNWELGASWLTQHAARHGHKMYVIYQTIHDPDINEYLIEMRGRYGLIMIDKDVSVMRVAHMLRNGAHIMLLNDVSGDGRVRVPFLGVDATNMPGAALMAMLSGAAVVPMCIYRDAPFEHEIEVFEPLKLPSEDEISNREERLRLTTLEINTAIEKFIRRRPELWFWLHNRWKN